MGLAANHPRGARGEHSVMLGMLFNAILAAVKIVTGFLGNASALVADGIESTADVLSSLIVLRGLKVARQEATERFQFGFGKAEAVAGATVALMLIVSSLAIAIQGARELAVPHHAPAPYTLFVLLCVVISKEWLFRRVSEVGSEIESTAMKGDAWHHRSDAITSTAAFFGILLALLGGPGWEIADDIAALFCAGIIAWTGTRLLREAVADLMDRAPDAPLLTNITKIAEAVPEVRLVEKLFARKTGLGYFVDMHVHADGDMSLNAAHIVSGKVKRAIMEAEPSVHRVLIHMEPAAPE